MEPESFENSENIIKRGLSVNTDLKNRYNKYSYHVTEERWLLLAIFFLFDNKTEETVARNESPSPLF